MYTRALTLLLATSVLPMLCATTLEQLSLADMAQKSTGIVRAKVTGSHSAYRGAEIYTYYSLQVEETWKAGSQTFTEVAVPGGSAKGVRQVVAGAPALTSGGDYVLFLWTSKSGLTQIMGLSQGLFTITQDTSGKLVVNRAPASELMLDQSGKVVQDQPMSMLLTDFHAQVQQSLGASK